MKSEHRKDIKAGIMAGIGLLALMVIFTSARSPKEEFPVDLKNQVSATTLYSSNLSHPADRDYSTK